MQVPQDSKEFKADLKVAITRYLVFFSLQFGRKGPENFDDESTRPSRHAPLLLVGQIKLMQKQI